MLMFNIYFNFNYYWLLFLQKVNLNPIHSYSIQSSEII